MIHLVVINLGYGNLSEGFPVVTVGLREADNPRSQQFMGSLPPAPNLIDLYRSWRSMYENFCVRLTGTSVRNYTDDDELEIDEAEITNVSILDFDDVCQQLQQNINNWLDSSSILHISRFLRAALHPTDEIRVIIETQDIIIQKLPWHCSNFFQDYPRTEISFARPEYQRTFHVELSEASRRQVRILAVLGNSQGINLEQEKKFLQSLPDAEIELIIQPSRQEFNDKLWDAQGWDILFFAGHSQTEAETGIIYINEHPTNNSLTIEQLTEALKAAIAKGLKIAIFNSCDGLGLAHSLEKLNLSTTIVMREPVPNLVAEEFFNYFLQAFAFNQKSLYTSVQQARRRLQGLEDDFPGASWLPVIFINPAEEAPTWESLKNNLPGQLTSQTQITQQRQDWGDAIDVSKFYGRDDEINQLKQYIISDNCRLITIIGMGGIGKTALSVKLAKLVEPEFDCLIWRSLRNAPPVEELLSDLIGFLSAEHQIVIAPSLEKRISQLIDCLTASRCLIVLDNLESVLDSKQQAGNYRQGYIGYGQLLRCLGDAQHQSCVLITSREKPKGLNARVGENLPVRSLTLKGLNYSEGELILHQKGLSPSTREIHRLIESYGGNPLALKIAATTITELFAGSISDFLATGTIICNDIFELLNQQLQRLPFLEKQVMYWLAIHRESVSLKELQNNLIDTSKPRDLMTALESLQSRCLIENQGGKFTQQPVVMEYLTEELIEEFTQELYSQEINLINKYAFIQAQAPDYLRNAQIQFILQPIADKILELWVTKSQIQTNLQQIITQLQSSQLPQPGYAAGNIINLLRQLNIQLNNYDFSHLNICQANLQGINLQQTNFAHCNFQKSLFTQTLGSLLAAKFSPTGKLFATAIENQIYLWEVENTRQIFTLESHTAWVRSLAFHPDGNILASGSNDNTIKLWYSETGEYWQTLTGHTSTVQSLAFSHDGNTLASGSDDNTARLWNYCTQECLQIFSGHSKSIIFVTFHPQKHILITASIDNTVRIWDIATGECLQIFNIHLNWHLAIALSHDGKILATGSHGNTIKFWDISNGECIQTLENYHSFVWSILFSQDDQTIITGSEDNTIKLWNISTGECLQTLQEHQQRVWLVDLHPHSSKLLSISEDQTIKLWDITSRRCFKTLTGYSNWILSLAFSPDGQTLASSSQDKNIRFWDMQTQKCRLTLPGHDNLVSAIAFAPRDNHLLASGSDDNTIKLWNHQGKSLHTLRGHSDWVYSVAFSPDGKILASGSRDRTIKIWNGETGECLHTCVGHENRVKSVTFHPHGTTLVSASDDQTLKIWDVNNFTCLKTLIGHQDKLSCVVFSPDGNIIASSCCNKIIKLWDGNTGECLQTISAHSSRIRAIAWTPDGKILASCSDDSTIKLWDIHRGENIRTLTGHDKAIWAIAISPDNQTLASGSEDQTIKLWHLQTGECMQTLRCTRPYEGMNISYGTGLTEAERTILKSLGASEQSD
ncbi:NB-ARC domain-containing protein [Calothrix sp. 336/3]|uniref:WD40 domain-containing protein n=1 Tax=Calothrix sp. 336/3 TaxID=1337936 RepID=UPI0004E467EF|nr:NB-ARC domain-containing protein [Calothrix sp. 336/3]AKG20076.1 hypothetical protein IJ00_01025 [Calothrix sp. 336/3]